MLNKVFQVKMVGAGFEHMPAQFIERSRCESDGRGRKLPYRPRPSEHGQLGPHHQLHGG